MAFSHMDFVNCVALICTPKSRDLPFQWLKVHMVEKTSILVIASILLLKGVRDMINPGIVSGTGTLGYHLGHSEGHEIGNLGPSHNHSPQMLSSLEKGWPTFIEAIGRGRGGHPLHIT